MKKTKIVCTMGPQEENIELVKQLIEAGMDVARFNFSHGTHEEQLARMNVIRQAREETGKPIAMLLDTKGPEIRTGLLKDGQKVELVTGNDIILTCEECVGTAERVSISYKDLYKEVEQGTTILVDDGLMELEVIEVNGKDILCRIKNGGMLAEKKGCNVPGVSIGLPAVTEQDIDDILWGIENGFDIIAASFIRNADAVREIKKLVRDHGSTIPVYSKIECSEALDNIDDIIAESDGIMVARGDLGVEIPSYRVPHIQKKIIQKCNKAYKPVITATQMLDSMIRNPRPTRAEASDVANAILDGTDAIMLSGETAAGKYPIEAVNTMSRIATYVEEHQTAGNRLQLMQEALRNATARTVANAVSYSCCQMAHDLGASAIITPSNSGTTARMVARFRPDCMIIAPTPSEHAYHQLGLSYGVIPARMDMSGDTDELIEKAVKAAEDMGYVKPGDVAIISAGVPTGVSGTTNLIKAHIVGNVLLRGIGVGSGCVSGRTCQVNVLSDLESNFEDGDIIVTKMTTSEMLPWLRKAAAVVVESTDPECHAAVACQALGIPLFMDRTDQAVHMLKGGMTITVTFTIRTSNVGVYVSITT